MWMWFLSVSRFSRIFLEEGQFQLSLSTTKCVIWTPRDKHCVLCTICVFWISNIYQYYLDVPYWTILKTSLVDLWIWWRESPEFSVSNIVELNNNNKVFLSIRITYLIWKKLEGTHHNADQPKKWHKHQVECYEQAEESSNDWHTTILHVSPQKLICKEVDGMWLLSI